MKKIVLFFDGTWNKPNENRDDDQETNVRIMYSSLLNNRNQFLYYDEGVGCEWYDSIIGGISGAGLSENIIQAYYFLTQTWNVGDEIYLFGFSRGAYTARSLAGMLYSCGMMKRNIINGEKLSREAFNIYKTATKEERNSYKLMHYPIPVFFIGVWDTVGALGIPITLLKGINSKLSQFHDTQLNNEVKFAYHALALDEEREIFTPTLWDETKKNEGQTISQVWFSGVHSDIGGGYPERFYSDITFRWMLEKIKDKLMLNEIKNTISDKQKIHNSYKFYFGPKVIRSLPIYGDDFPSLHKSVLNLISDGSYKSAALNYVDDWTTLHPYRIDL